MTDAAGGHKAGQPDPAAAALATFTSIGISLGVAIGAVAGILTDNLALGIGPGIAIGAGLGVAVGTLRMKQIQDQQKDGQPD